MFSEKWYMQWTSSTQQHTVAQVEHVKKCREQARGVQYRSTCPELCQSSHDEQKTTDQDSLAPHDVCMVLLSYGPTVNGLYSFDRNPFVCKLHVSAVTVSPLQFITVVSGFLNRLLSHRGESKLIESAWCSTAPSTVLPLYCTPEYRISVSTVYSYSVDRQKDQKYESVAENTVSFPPRGPVPSLIDGGVSKLLMVRGKCLTYMSMYNCTFYVETLKSALITQ